MSKNKKENSFMAIALVAVIIVAVVAVVYISMNPEEKKDEGETDDENTDNPQDQNETGNQSAYFLVIYNGNETNYTLSYVETFENFTGSGSFMSQKGIQNATNYTGIKITTILDQLENLSANYSVNITAIDGWFKVFNSSMANGNMSSENNCTSCNVTMLIAYKKEGAYLGDDEGPFRVVFVDSDAVTSSKYWIQNVVSIEIIEE